MIQLTAIPAEITATCKNDKSIVSVRIRADEKTKGIKIDALGYDPVVVKLNPPKGETNDEGVFELKVSCEDDAPCPANTIVTFDAGGGSTPCTLTVTCSDRKKGGS
jgi:hypothetical protein